MGADSKANPSIAKRNAVALAAASYSTTQTISGIDTDGANGIIIYFRITSTGASAATVTLVADLEDGNTVDIFAANVNAGQTGTAVIQVRPGMLNSTNNGATFPVTASYVLPRILKLRFAFPAGWGVAVSYTLVP